MNVAFFAANILLGVAVTVAIQLADRRRMTAEERRWVWNFATWGQAVYNFGPLSLVAWGYVTRSPRYVRGLAIGVGEAAVAFAAQAVLAEGVGRALGLPAKVVREAREGFLAAILVAAALGVLVGCGRFVHDLVRSARRR